MTKPFGIGFGLGLALLVAFGYTTSRSKGQSPEQARYQAELPDATHVRSGELTEQQRVHSRLFSYYAAHTEQMAYRSLREWAAHSKGKAIEAVVSEFDGLPTDPETPEKFVGRLVRESDAIVRGRVVQKASQITEDEGFVFTDYLVNVSEVLMDNRPAPISTGSNITVTRPGGKVLLDGLIIKATDNALAPLQVNGNEVLLFLRFVPETGCYSASRATDAFELQGRRLNALTGAPIPPGVLTDTDSFTRNIRSFVTN